jgi:hypothetical protein
VGSSQRLTTVNTEQLVSEELGIARGARFAIVMPAVYYLVQLINLQVNASAWRTLGHQLRIAWDAAQAGRPTPQYHTGNLVSPFSVFVALATLAAVVVACIWQHRAATTARALGFPSRRSPAWGVVSWFVPVVNLWIPYGAIRDCLPIGDPQRAHVLRWWIAWVIGFALSGAASLCALFSTGVALAVSVPAAIALLAVMAWAPGVVMSIAVAHRRALSAQAQDTGAFRR